jgi:hypothetical protein
MSDKKLILFDNNEGKEKCAIQRTDIIIRNSDTQEVTFRGSNKVIVSGSAFTAAKHWNITPQVLTTSYNNVLALDNTVNEPYLGNGIRNEELVFLFAVGLDGCGPANNQVYEVDYGKWIPPEYLVPFRYQLDTNDLAGSLRDKYFGRKTLSNRIAYYFKAFEADPVFKQQYVDGTPIDENVYLSSRTEEIESYVEVLMKVTKEDCRDYFLATTGIADAKINTISLLTAWAKVIDGITYYQDIRPLTKLNFPNEQLIDLTKGIDIIYHIYY